MAELFGLVISLVVMAFVLLPVLSFLRLGRLSRELEELSERVAALESTRAAATASHVASPETASGAVVAPDVPAAAVAPPLQPELAHTFSYVAVETTSEERAPGDGRPEPASTIPAAAEEGADLESRIGGRGLLYVGVLVLLFGVSFFLKYAFDNSWVDETGRVVLGAGAGVALVVGGWRLSRGGLDAFGQALSGLGFAVLYLVVYSAFTFYELIGRSTAFAAMGLVTLAAATVAHRIPSQALAFIAVGGGFLTPFLVGGDENAQITLFSYDAILVAGAMVLALRHQWLALNALTYVMTVLTILAWSGRFYTGDQWLRTLLFLTLFCVLFLIILREAARARGLVARLVTWLLASAPVFYHVAAVVITAMHPPAIHVYLIAFTAAGLWLTADPQRPWVRFMVLVGGFAPLFGTLTLPDGISWMVPNMVTIIAVAALHTMGILDRIVRREEQLETPDLIALHLTGLGLFALLYEALQPVYPNVRGILALLIALASAGLWRWLQNRDRVAALNAAALTATLIAIGIAVQFDGSAVVIGWAAEGVAVAWVGLRAPSVSFQIGGLVLWGLAALRLLEGYFTTPASFTPIINARALATLFVVGLGYAMAWLCGQSTVRGAGRTRALVHVVVAFITISWITAEIQSFWEVRYDSSQAHLYKQVMLSLSWGLYGALLIVLGMKRSYPPVRYIGMTILAVTVLKVFFYDLWELGGIYRVIGFLVFGVLLVLVSYLYQKRRMPDAMSDSPPPPAS